MGKDDIAYSAHVNPTSYSTAGLQKTDFLSYLSFVRATQCPFTSFKRCYVKWVDEDFDAEAFADAFERGYQRLEQAQRSLEACGFTLRQPEGWGYFQGGPSSTRHRSGPSTLGGDGHTSTDTKVMQSSEDATFFFRFTFISTPHEKGFVTHYRPKHPPLSIELESVFRYLGLDVFGQCPEFDFESCHFRTLRFEQRGEGFFDSNTEYAHRCFNAHATQFSLGIENLLAANAAVEEVGLSFLPISKPSERLVTEIAKQIVRATPAPSVGRTRTMDAALPNNFDVAISFAGTERPFAKDLADRLQQAGVTVFYDDYYPEHLWGKNLTAYFDEIYRKRANYCIVFVSREYRDRKWTNHEFRSAQARALEAKGQEYILPIKVDDTDLDGLPSNVGYVGVDMGIDRIASMLLAKLGRN